MMGVSHAYSGVVVGCALASLGMPHAATIPEIAGHIYAAGSAGGGIGPTLLAALAAFGFAFVTGLLLPGFLVPDAWTANPPLLVLGLFVLILGGAALMPDLDHVSSTVARTLGPITGVLSHGLNRLSLTIYHATRLPGDPPERRDGHRLITHTWPGSAGFGVIALTCQLAHPIAAGAVVGISVGLLAVGVRRMLRKIPVVRAAPGMVLGMLAGMGGWWCSVQYSGWSLLFPLAVMLGCMVHREGDWCTNSGVPRRLWGIPQNAGTMRWAKNGAPRRFDTGGDYERYAVRHALLAGAVVAAAGFVLMPEILPALLASGGEV